MKTVEDLKPHAARALEEAYQHRSRIQASREDFSSGFIAALEWLRSTSSFVPEQEPETA